MERCRNCIYRAERGAPYRCDYNLFTGHTRRAQPPEKCTYFHAGPRLQPGQERAAGILPKTALPPRGKRRGGKPPRFDWGLGEELWRQGKNDGEISRSLGCSVHTVCAWRGRRGLPANAKPGGRGKTK